MGLIVDNFAGGGGASTGIEAALRSGVICVDGSTQEREKPTLRG